MDKRNETPILPMFVMELFPAYGRTYETEAAALKDWNDGKDWIIWRGPYCSIRDVKTMRANGYTHVHLMYNVGRASVTFRI